MAGSARQIQVYDVNGNKVTMPPQPIISKRAPTVNDREELGTLWIDTVTNSVYCLVEVSGRTATWTTSPASGIGSFTTLEVTGGDLDVTAVGGDISVASGNVELLNGNLSVAGNASIVGDLTVTGDFIYHDSDKVDIKSVYNGAQAIYIHSDGGANETVELYSAQGTNDASVKVSSLVGGVTIQGSKATASAVTINSPAGGMSLNATGSAGKDIVVANTGGSVSITASEAVADAIVIDASDAAGGVQIKAGTNGILIGKEADTSAISLGDIAPTASRTVTISSGTVATAAVTDLVSIAAGGASTNATSIKQVDIATGALAVGEHLVNIATGNVTSGTHTTSIGTGTGTKTIAIGNVDGLTTVTIDGISAINDSCDVATSINTGTSTGTVSIGNAAAGAITLDTSAGISLDAATASNFTVTGAADLTLESTGGAVNIISSEGSVDAISIQALGTVGEGIDIDADTGGIAIDSLGGINLGAHAPSSFYVAGATNGLSLGTSEGSLVLEGGKAAADAVVIYSSDVAGGIDIDAGTAGIVIDTTGALSLDSAAASNFTVTGAFDLDLESTAGSINVTAGEAAVDAIVINASDAASGIDVDAGTAGITIDTTGALSLDSAAASNLTVTGAFDLDLNSTLGSVNVASGKEAVDAIVLSATGAASGISIGAGTNGIDIGTTGALSLDAAAASYLTVTGAFDLTVDTTLGSLNLSAGEAAVDAIVINASDAASGIDIDAGTAGIAIDTTGALSLDSAGASNFTVTGAADLTVATTAGSLNLTAGEAAADAIVINASDAASGIDIDAGTSGIIVDTTGALSLDSAAASNVTVTGAFDLTLNSTAGSVNITGGEAVADAIVIDASNAAGGITITAGTGGIFLDNSDIKTTPATDTQASPTAASTIDNRIGFVTFTGFTTASAGTEVFTISNSLVTAASAIMVTASNLGGNDAQMTVTRVIPGAGSFTVTLTNNGAAALNGNVSICFWVLN